MATLDFATVERSHLVLPLAIASDGVTISVLLRRRELSGLLHQAEAGVWLEPRFGGDQWKGVADGTIRILRCISGQD